jgi:hypothetical protein
MLIGATAVKHSPAIPASLGNRDFPDSGAACDPREELLAGRVVKEQRSTIGIEQQGGRVDDLLQQRFQNDLGGDGAHDFEQEGLLALPPLGLFEGLCVFEGCSRLQRQCFKEMQVFAIRNRRRAC